MRTAAMIVAIGLVGTLLSLGAHWRAERIRSAYRVRALSDTLSLVRNENGWLRGGIERKRTPWALERVVHKKRIGPFVHDLPVVPVVPLPHGEVPGL